MGCNLHSTRRTWRRHSKRECRCRVVSRTVGIAKDIIKTVKGAAFEVDGALERLFVAQRGAGVVDSLDAAVEFCLADL